MTVNDDILLKVFADSYYTYRSNPVDLISDDDMDICPDCENEWDYCTCETEGVANEGS